MSQVTIYTCDRCGAQSESTDFLATLAAGKRTYNYSWTIEAAHTKDLCAECQKAIGLWTNKQEKDAIASGEKLPDRPTFEELVREIVRDETSNSRAN